MIFMHEKKSVVKSVRLRPSVLARIEGWEGKGFNEKIENMVIFIDGGEHDLRANGEKFRERNKTFCNEYRQVHELASRVLKAFEGALIAVPYKIERTLEEGMEYQRLTWRDEDGAVTTYNPVSEHSAGDKEMRERLAAYEDVGFSPEELQLFLNSSMEEYNNTARSSAGRMY